MSRVGFKGGQWEKTQNLNDVQHRDWNGNVQGSEGHINFSREIELKREKREDLGEKVKETALGIRPSSNLEKKTLAQENS
jgi:hypothetical protein